MIVPEKLEHRARVRGAIHANFWDQAVQSVRALDGLARTLPCEPPPLGQTCASGLSRTQQLLALHALWVPFVPAFDANSGGLVRASSHALRLSAACGCKPCALTAAELRRTACQCLAWPGKACPAMPPPAFSCAAPPVWPGSLPAIMAAGARPGTGKDWRPQLVAGAAGPRARPADACRAPPRRARGARLKRAADSLACTRRSLAPCVRAAVPSEQCCTCFLIAQTGRTKPALESLVC